MKLIFDTDCVLCSGWVHFLLRHERDEATLQFINAWSPTGAALASQHGLGRAELEKTFLLIDGEQALTRSDAVLALVAHLKFPWSVLRHLALVPRPLRDGVYTVVARNRYRWFGRKNSCFVPPAHVRGRFIDQ